ncbi:hypothetical protein TNCV_129811 [Trichonephila clavipes]|nr:hypothetical protein TNCV_129811 [Trichonephila clavipes]
MVSCGISCQICSNCQPRSATFLGRCRRLPIMSKTCSIGDRFVDRAQAGHIATRSVCGLALSCWKIKRRYCRWNGSKTDLRISSTYRCAVSVTVMTTKGVRMSKEMTPQTITLG